MARFAVVLDTCVLFPIVLCDSLLRIAEEGLYRPLWSHTIIDELRRTLGATWPNNARVLDERIDDMVNAFEDAMVEGLDSVAIRRELPDPNDWHVVAAAIVGHADAIVTRNLKDFPNRIMKDFNLEVIHPDDFLVSQLDLRPRSVVSALDAQQRQLQRPPATMEELLTWLERAGVPKFARAAAKELRISLPRYEEPT